MIRLQCIAMADDDAIYCAAKQQLDDESFCDSLVFLVMFALF